MTLATGPVALATSAREVRPNDAAPRRASGRRHQLANLVVGLDVLVAVTVAGAAAIYPTPGGTVRGVILLGWPVAIALAGGYSRLTTEPRRFPGRALLAAALGASTAVWSLPALIPGAGTDESPRTLASVALFLAAMVYAGSATARGLLALAAPAQPVPTVLLGHRSQVRELLEESARPGGRRAFDPVAVCLPDSTDDVDPMTETWPVPVTLGLDNLLEVVRTHHAEAVVIAPGPDVDHAYVRRWGARLQHEDVRLLVSPGLRDVAPHRIGRATLGGDRMLSVHPAPLRGPSRLVKDVVDRAAGGLLLIAFAPLLGVLALLVRADTPGQAFYRQTRVGWHGRPFSVYKLRTMCADADRIRTDLEDSNESDQEGVLFKMKRDPRITRVGAFLRLSSLDELPQLLNVVRGEMSLIGPRPALPSEVQAYAPDLRRRLDVKPGMTGLWQVSGRSDLPWDETVRLDLQYVDNWSWWMDVRIALRTATAVVSRRGAY